MTSANYKQLFSSLNNRVHQVKSMYDDLVKSEERVAELERQIVEKDAEIERLAGIIADKPEVHYDHPGVI
jgi:hypothetical protein